MIQNPTAAVDPNRGAKPQNETRVLLIEDDLNYANVVKRCLALNAEETVSVVHVVNLGDGMRELSHGSTDVVLVDLCLPDSDGLESFRALFGRFPQIPIVVLSGHDDKEQGARAVELGAQDYLVKQRVNAEVIQRALRYAQNRKRVEEQLRRSEEQLLHAQKMEGLGRLAGGVAHDFNNLLTSILGFGHIVLSNLQESSPMRADMEEIVRAGERATNLTRQLLAFGRNEIADVKSVSLNQVVQSMMNMLTRSMGPAIDLRTDLCREDIHIKADAGRIEQVILNLVVNAKDALPDGGIITLSTSHTNLDESFCASRHGLRPGPTMLLAVRDNGCGIPKHLLPLVFEPFFTTKPRGKGTGLGLSMAYGIVQLFGGYIELESEAGNGTEVRIFFPCVAAPSAGNPPRSARPMGMRGGTETLLLVEDESSLRRLGRRLLEELGYTILEAEDGVQGLKVFEENKARIDLVLTDVMMPHMGGREMMQSLRASHENVKVLYLSGYAGEPGVDGEEWCDDALLIRKPYTVETLASRIREILEL